MSRKWLYNLNARLDAESPNTNPPETPVEKIFSPPASASSDEIWPLGPSYLVQRMQSSFECPKVTAKSGFQCRCLAQHLKHWCATTGAQVPVLAKSPTPASCQYRPWQAVTMGQEAQLLPPVKLTIRLPIAAAKKTWANS